MVHLIFKRFPKLIIFFVALVEFLRFSPENIASGLVNNQRKSYYIASSFPQTITMSMRPDDHRRKWDKDEFERIAAERLQAELDEEERSQKKAPPVKRELLKQRDYKVDLDSKLGKSVVINKNTPTSQSGGYYCNVCDCVVKDSINFLDHINGKKHQRNLGMSMKIERSSLDQVKARFALNKRKLEEKKREYELDSRLKEAAEEEVRVKELRRERKRDKKRKLHDNEDDDDTPAPSQLAQIMGFSGFGGAKK